MCTVYYVIRDCCWLYLEIFDELHYSLMYFLLQDIFSNFRLWKLIVSIFAFSSAPELMFGLYLLYYFRVFERQIGSNKYSVSIYPFMLLSSQ